MNLIDKETYKILYKMLDIAPIEGNCGDLCGKVCCNLKDNNFGMYLLPGEESLFMGNEDWLTWEKHSTIEYDFPDSWQKLGSVYFIRCKGFCPREKRPLQCRTFPLTPHISPEGKLNIIWETLNLPYKCPLILKKYPLNSIFIENTFYVWKKLIKNSLIRDLIVLDSNQRIIEGSHITILKSK